MKLPELPAELTDFKPEVGLILGSGLGFFADDRIEVVGRLPYGEIEDFPVSTVPGHAGQFVYGHLDGKRVLCMQGRFHFYEGYTMAQLTLPIRLMAQLGVHTIFVTNAAGGINRDYVPGDFMLLSDHINFLGTNPLIGNQSNDDTRFPDMSEVYD
ncbi:MAG: purine-nucleoside phosphorylase, partial [Opitutales bacterium]|nr:purine-nucleoside phosphorylase [Opitutales bacterium]